MVLTTVAGLFCGKLLSVPGIGFRIILGPDAHPSGMFLAIDFRCRILLTSVSINDVGKFGFIVKVSRAVNVRDWFGSRVLIPLEHMLYEFVLLKSSLK